MSTKDDVQELCTWPPHCYENRVSGSEYCEDHLIEAQVAARAPAPMGTLAAMIRKAKGKGWLKPVSAYHGS